MSGEALHGCMIFTQSTMLCNPNYNPICIIIFDYYG